MIQCALAALLVMPTQSYDQTMPDQMKEAFGKVVATAGELKSSIPSLGFRAGACLLGGSLKQNGKFTYKMNSPGPAVYAVLTGAYGNDWEIDVVVTNSAGKNVVTEKEAEGITFEAAAAGTYTVTATNKGAASFVGLALLQAEGGTAHSFSAINTSVAKIASGVKEVYPDDFKLVPNTLAVVGSLLDPGKSFNREDGFNYPNTLVFAASDGGAKSFDLSITDKATNEKIGAVEDKVYAACGFAKAIEKASVSLKSTSTKRVFVITAELH